jgi:hypothetical protein
VIRPGVEKNRTGAGGERGPEDFPVTTTPEGINNLNVRRGIKQNFFPTSGYNVAEKVQANYAQTAINYTTAVVIATILPF